MSDYEHRRISVNQRFTRRVVDSKLCQVSIMKISVELTLLFSLNPRCTGELIATAIDQANGNEDVVNRVGQRLPLNVCTVEGLRSLCSLAGPLQ